MDFQGRTVGYLWVWTGTSSCPFCRYTEYPRENYAHHWSLKHDLWGCTRSSTTKSMFWWGFHVCWVVSVLPNDEDGGCCATILASLTLPMGRAVNISAFQDVGPMGGAKKTISKWSLVGWWFQIFFSFTRICGEMIQFDDHIFQMGWFNHLPCLKRWSWFCSFVFLVLYSMIISWWTGSCFRMY